MDFHNMNGCSCLWVQNPDRIRGYISLTAVCMSVFQFHLLNLQLLKMLSSSLLSHVREFASLVAWAFIVWLVIGYALKALFSRSSPPSAASRSWIAYERKPVLSKCGICFATMTFKLVYNCSSCHISVCAGCTRSYIESKVQDGMVSSRNLVCPTPACSRAFPKRLIEVLTDTEMFQKYKSLLKNQTIGLRFCPRVGCGAALEEPLYSQHRHVTCSSCLQESCMRCGGAFHRIPLCRRVEWKLRKWMKQQCKTCPNCLVLIEKNGGCNHMTCTLCQHQFCWRCRRPWRSHRCS